MPTTKKKSSIVNLVLILITLLAIGAAAYLWFQNSLQNTVKEPEEPEVTSPVFITLKPFTISLPASEENIDINKTLYIGVVLRVANENQKTVLLDYLPEVRNNVLLVTSKQYVSTLKQEVGKIDLQEQIKNTLSRQYNAKNFVEIDEVLFTDFIIR
ncbi:flagellar basal body-associated FliL family protein [Gilliamella sp. ESL0254]|uniref:flagellar basal body-associated FliL family protein n=1 Tax=Gilliamella sp. ESL0254 TaxID=2705035 RepID=UPI00158107F5|nr:flagellar basal body-associated FliL family protein [Gilliamella sp. ESL0254]NUF27916.1 flagellar basal body-associated protein FliL [Gilliamella sp. ESL0254]